MKKHIIAAVLCAGVLASIPVFADKTQNDKSGEAKTEDAVTTKEDITVGNSLSYNITDSKIVVPVSPRKEEVQSTDNSEELEKVIKKAKTIIGNTEDYEQFNNSVNSYGDITYYHLYWNSSKTDKPDIDVTIGADGTIYTINYNRKDYVYSSTYKIPEITKTTALETAYKYTEKVNPEIINLISKKYATVSYSSGGHYYVNFYSTYNNLLITNNTISVTLTSNGDVINYSSYNIAKNVSKPSAPKLLGSAALAVFKREIPFELVYKTYFPENSDKAQVKLVYQLNKDYRTKAVNAETGEVYNTVNENNQYIPYSFGSETERASKASDSAEENYSLSPAEQKNVDERADFIAITEITKKIQETAEFDVPELKLTNSNLYYNESFYTKDITYIRNLYYSYTNDSGYLNATVNAKTGEILSINYYDYNRAYGDKKAAEYPYTQLDSKKAAEEFLVKYYKDKFAEYKAEELTEHKADENIYSYYFNYYRYVNGIKFLNDVISISVDPQTLKINNFYISYSGDASFPSPDKKITAEAAVDKYFAVTGINAFYVTTLQKNEDNNLVLVTDNHTGKQKTLIPVYAYSENFIIDALTGEAINGYNGGKYEFTETSYFKDIIFGDIKSSVYRKQIEILADMDIIKSDVNFFPSRNITQKEFDEILSKLYYKNYNYGSSVLKTIIEEESNITADYTDKANITREEALKIIVNAMGYKKIAELKGIFNCPITDSALVDEENVGYISIACGLGLNIFGEKLDPKTLLTREEAAAIIYNCLLNN